MGKTEELVSPLGFGMMRPPLKNGEQGSPIYGMGQIDERASIDMLRHAIDMGINYVDTAYNYQNGGSEIITGNALLDGYREKVFVATKSPVFMYTCEDDFDRFLNEQLKRLHTDYIDFYLLHGLSADTWHNLALKFGAPEKILAAKKAGKVRHIGFSFHDSFDAFREIVDFWDEWEFCQIQLNYIDANSQAGLKGLKYAAERDLGVSIMEPLRGGYLANVPDRVKQELDVTGKTPVELALDYLWNMPEVSVVLSGMGSINQAEENIAYAEKAEPGMMSETDSAAVKNAVHQFASFDNIPCTGCNYCSGCPKGIGISTHFSAYNEYQTHGDIERAKKYYKYTVPLFGAYATECIGCGACEKICPQHLKITELLPKVVEMFAE